MDGDGCNFNSCFAKFNTSRSQRKGPQPTPSFKITVVPIVFARLLDVPTIFINF